MSDKPDFVALWQRWSELEPGRKAELRRVRVPGDLTEVPAFYRLIGADTRHGWRRVVYCLPWAEHASGAAPLGASFAQAKVSEKRLFQVIRSQEPNDLIQLRRLLQQARPKVDWTQLGPQLYWWSDDNKRRLLEDFYRMPRAVADH